ncbi:jg9221 [Pararge aegeria aegeria]|uniref:Jg9221 protein n=1 Tax=Pararge aegeria aegeria TaxID=348720 RepID=A0A8S4SFS4_9NEOP|nr:jg9221 [Pararge aegeria aegeria]
MSPELTKNIFSSSDNSEDIDDLLSEYQHYLDKAHKQRINYIEKSKGKNKVPQVHYEKYTKIKKGTRNNYDVPNNYLNKKYATSSFLEPLNLFMSHNAKLNMDNKSKFTDRPQDYNEETPNTLMQINNEHALLNLIPSISNPNIPLQSCYCKVNQIPCKCSCKQCFLLTDSLPTQSINEYDNQNIFIESFPKTSTFALQNKRNSLDEDKFNIRLKIDVQLPKILYELIHNDRNQDKKIGGGKISKELISTVNLPFPHLNFPIPINLLGIKQLYSKQDNSDIHKITIHKKKKSRLGNNNKKHMGKKVTSHSIKVDPIDHNMTDEDHRISSQNYSLDSNTEIQAPKLQTNKPLTREVIYNANHTVTDLPIKNINGSIETLYLTLNITKNNDNDTGESLKIGNSIETDFIEKNNKTTVELRLKREALEKNITFVTQINTNISATTVMPPKISRSMESDTKEAKKFNKTKEGEMELLYWPTESKNFTLVKSKNITFLILERETKKAKLNMTEDRIRNNRTLVLEHAIFGDVDWNDVDTVAPVFMSFVGKYIKGILTFCSQSVCHSMKCAEKTCLHRICSPDNRFNYKGHCKGNKDTDSVAALESIMDLPSNIGFKIVDILQDKMLGKMYGKATLCIISKCSTFVASKKKFQSSKCTTKELSSLGHCSILKNVKMS